MTDRPHRHRIPWPASLVTRSKLLLLMLCVMIGCYLPSTVGPISRPLRGDRPVIPPTLTIIPAPHNVQPSPLDEPRTGQFGRELPVWQPQTAMHDWKYIVLHHTASNSGSVDSIDRTHRERTDADGNHWRGIGYHFVIGNGVGMGDGEVQPTFRWMEQSAGAHAGDLEYNTFGIGICLVGNFEEHPPTPAQLAAVKQLVALLKDVLDIDSSAVLRHGDVKATECPGRLFPHEEIALARRAHAR